MDAGVAAIGAAAIAAAASVVVSIINVRKNTSQHSEGRALVRQLQELVTDRFDGVDDSIHEGRREIRKVGDNVHKLDVRVAILEQERQPPAA